MGLTKKLALAKELGLTRELGLMGSMMLWIVRVGELLMFEGSVIECDKIIKFIR